MKSRKQYLKEAEQELRLILEDKTSLDSFGHHFKMKLDQLKRGIAKQVESTVKHHKNKQSEVFYTDPSGRRQYLEGRFIGIEVLDIKRVLDKDELLVRIKMDSGESGIALLKTVQIESYE